MRRRDRALETERLDLTLGPVRLVIETQGESLYNVVELVLSNTDVLIEKAAANVRWLVNKDNKDEVDV